MRFRVARYISRYGYLPRFKECWGEVGFGDHLVLNLWKLGRRINIVFGSRVCPQISAYSQEKNRTLGVLQEYWAKSVLDTGQFSGRPDFTPSRRSSFKPLPDFVRQSGLMAEVSPVSFCVRRKLVRPFAPLERSPISKKRGWRTAGGRFRFPRSKQKRGSETPARRPISEFRN